MSEERRFGELGEDGIEVDVFIETTRWLDLELRLQGANLTDFDRRRMRTIFVGERNLSPIDVTEIRERADGREVLLTIAGSF